MEVPGTGTRDHQRVDQEHHQKVDLIMKVIHQITIMKTTVANCRQMKKRTWKDQTFLIQKKEQGINLEPPIIILSRVIGNAIVMS